MQNHSGGDSVMLPTLPMLLPPPPPPNRYLSGDMKQPKGATEI